MAQAASPDSGALHAATAPAAPASSSVAHVQTPAQTLADAVAAIDAGSWRDPRRFGLWVMRLGIATALGGLVLKIGLLNTGVISAMVGWALCRVPLWRLAGFWWGLTFAGWCLMASLVAKYGGGDADPIHGYGLLYSWLALYLGQAAFTGPRGRRVLAGALMGLTATVFASTLLASMQFFIGHHNDYPWRLLQAPLGERAVISEGFEDINLTQGFVMSVVALLMGFGPGHAEAKTRAGTSVGTADHDRLPMVRRHRWLAGAMATFAVLISGARGAVLGGSCGIWAGCAGFGWRFLLRAVLVTVVVGICAVAALAVLRPDKFDAMRHGHDGRWVIWRTSVAMIAAHPVTGVGGPEAFKRSFNETFPVVAPGEIPEFAGGAPHAHNSFLTIAANHGIPAVFLYIVFLAAALRGAFRGGWGRALALAVVADAVIDGQFEDLAGHTVPAYALFLTLAVASLPGRAASIPMPAEASTPLAESSR
jgi:hypothetical protein